MEFFTKHKKLVFIVMSFVFSLFTFLSIVYTKESGKTNQYKLSSDGKVIIKEIWINGSNQKKDKFSGKYNLSYDEQDEYIILNNNFEIELPVTYNFDIMFEKDKDYGTVTLEKNGSLLEKIDLNSFKKDTKYFTYDVSNLGIIKNYFNDSFNVIHIFIALISSFLYYILLHIINSFIIKIKKDNVDYKTILGYFIACLLLIINNIYILIEFIGSLSIFFYVIPLVIGLYALRDSLKSKIHYLLIYLMIPIGIIFALSMPIGHVPDETAHFYKSFILSTKVIMKDVDKDKDYCIKSQVDINDVLGEYNFDVHNYHYTLKPRAFYSNYLQSYDITNTDKKHCYLNVSKLPFVGYTLTTTILVLSQLLHIPILLTYLLGRLINFMFYILIVYYCLKNIPKYKKSLFIISTVPIAIQAACGFNQDCVHNALFILLFTKIIQSINNKDKFNLKEMLTIIIISLLLSFCKLGYFPIILLCLLIPRRRFKNKRTEIIYKMLLVLPMLLSFLILYFSLWDSGTTSAATNSNVYSIYSFFKNPIDFIRLYLGTVKIMGFYMVVQGLADGFGWSTKYNSEMINCLLTVCYALLLFNDSKEKKNEKSYIIVSITAALMIIFLIMTSMLGLNEIGASYINGLQPRYFIAPLLLILSTLNLNLIEYKNKNKNREFIYGILVLLIYVGVLTTIISGFYV